MKKHIFSVDKKTGYCKDIDKIDDADDKKQILMVEGIDSGFILDIGVKDPEGNWVYLGKYLITKYFNYEEKSEMSIVVGNYTIQSISRIIPNFEYDFEVKDDRSGIISKKIYNSYQQGLSALANEE